MKFTSMFALFLILLLPYSGIAEEPKSADWELKGTLAALNDPDPGARARALRKLGEMKSHGTIPRVTTFLIDNVVDLRSAAAEALGRMGEAAKEQAPEIAKLLKDPERVVRLVAVRALGSIGGAAKEQAPEIAKLLKDSEPYVRAAAAEALGSMGAAAKEQAPEIVKLLKDSEPYVRAAAAKALGRMGEAAKEQAPEIAKLLKDSERTVRAAAAEALGRMGEAAKEQAPEITKLLKDREPDGRAAAAEALGRMGEAAKGQAPEIVKLLKAPEPYVHAAATGALRRMGEVAKEQAPEITKLLKDPNPNVRAEATEVLGSMGEAAKGQVPEITKLLKDPDPNVRATAARALGSMGEAAKGQAPEITKLLKDPESYVQLIAARALGSMGEAAKGQAPEIVKLLKDSERAVRLVAAEALGSMGEAAKGQVPEIAKLLKDSNPNVRAMAVDLLGRMGEAAKEQAPEIAKLLKDSDPNVRATATRVLGSMGEAAKGQAPEIAKLLKDSDPNIRATATRVLGSMGEAAKEQAPEIAKLLKDSDPNIRATAAEALGRMGEAAKEQAPEITKLLKDREPDGRAAAAEALGRMGEAAKEQAPEIAKLLKDSDPNVRAKATRVLGKIGPLGLHVILNILDTIYYDASRSQELRFLAHLVGGGETSVETLIQWLGRSGYHPDALAYNEGVLILKIFKDAWEESSEVLQVRGDLEKQIAVVVQKTEWTFDDLPLLQSHASNLKLAGSTHYPAVASVIDTVSGKRWVLKVGTYWLGHAAFWLLLIFVYPRSRVIQAIFFWNPWVRRITGLVYVELLLTYFPYLRNKLFSPFRVSLLADAALEDFNPQMYFEESEVKIKSSSATLRLTETISAVKGQIVLQGESGLGKTMFLRQLVRRSTRLIVYLPATKCSKGVIEAIQDKLHGHARDAVFLRKLIYSGALDLIIDGLNEVSAETRANISNFVETYFTGNIIMATQPLEWTPPATAKIYLMQPLSLEQIKKFLLTREESFFGISSFSRADYETACNAYITETLSKSKEMDAVQRILSNPMDLTVVARMLALKKSPNLLDLQKQYYDFMADDYRQVYNNDFPLRTFSEEIYQRRLNDRLALSEETFFKELQCMERHKMIVTRQSVDAQGSPMKQWYFRHDKIMEFFIVQTFLGGSNDRPQKHLGDPRFRGVYFLLATLLSKEDAGQLREQLIQYAADTKDHTISDTFIQLLRARN